MFLSYFSFTTFTCAAALTLQFVTRPVFKKNVREYGLMQVTMATVCTWHCAVCDRFLFMPLSRRQIHLILCLRRLFFFHEVVVWHTGAKTNAAAAAAAAVCECLFTLCTTFLSELQVCLKGSWNQPHGQLISILHDSLCFTEVAILKIRQFTILS